MQNRTQWFHPKGSLPRGDWESVVDERIEGWHHTRLHVGSLEGGQQLGLPAGNVERMVIPLHGDVQVDWTSEGRIGQVSLVGRASVFDGPADTAYFGIRTQLTITGSGRVAIAEAPATKVLPIDQLKQADVPIEIRGAGSCSRQVHNFGVPGVMEAQRLIVCEVITPAGNWSSFPPHKHDEAIDGVESKLEEIYYFEASTTRGATPKSADPFGLFYAYSSTAGQISTNEMVRNGDIALVPFGFHGPAVAPPGYDLYYLNVMAGPGDERVWNITDDPEHRWLRDTWLTQPLDARLPYRPSGEGHLQ